MKQRVSIRISSPPSSIRRTIRASISITSEPQVRKSEERICRSPLLTVFSQAQSLGSRLKLGSFSQRFSGQISSQSCAGRSRTLCSAMLSRRGRRVALNRFALTLGFSCSENSSHFFGSSMTVQVFLSVAGAFEDSFSSLNEVFSAGVFSVTLCVSARQSF